MGNNSSVIVQVYSNGAAGNGNDYAIDDIAFTEAQVDTVLNSTKYVDKAYASLGDILKYTVTLENTGQSTAQNIVFSDTIPTGTVFNTNSVNTQVNNASLGGIVKSVNKAYASCNDILIYTITVPNSGNTTALGVTIKDTIPNGTIFVPGTVTIDGIGTSYTPDSMYIGTIPAAGQAVIRFNVQVSC